MAKASASFHLDGEFYAEGSVLPKDVASRVGKHLIAKAPAKASEQEAQQTETKEPAKTPEANVEEWAEKVRAMNNEQLVEAAKSAGITGSNKKADLIEKLIENGEPA